MTLLDPRPPRVMSIAPGLSFTDVLAAHILADFGDDPLALADITILLPNRRAVRAMREAFLRQCDGKLTILPRLAPLGDVDEDQLALSLPKMGARALDIAPAIAKQDRLALLAQLIITWRGGRLTDQSIAPGPAYALARDLASLLDSVASERLDFSGLERLVPERHAAHWQTTLEFLEILTHHWPNILGALGTIDPIDRRNRLMQVQCQLWRDNPPTGLVIAAGSTGTMPATADLLSVIARLPKGLVILPGFDATMDDAQWQAIGETPTHPWHSLHRLLNVMALTRHDVVDLPGMPDQHRAMAQARSALLKEALLPPTMTHRWRPWPEPERQAAIRNMVRIDCRDTRQEATTIALALRHALLTPGKTAALVTPDRRLARRVSAELGRWAIEVDDSGGQPLANTSRGVFLRLILDVVETACAPVALLALFKHPLCTAGAKAGDLAYAARQLDQVVLRGPRPAPGIAGLEAIMQRAADNPDTPFHDRARAHIQSALEMLMPLFDAMAHASAQPAALLDSHLHVAERLAASPDQDGAVHLWSGEEGEALASHMTDCRAGLVLLETMAPVGYPALFQELIGDAVVRPRFGKQPRLFIWGPIEARLQCADLMILGGLNEGSWPQTPKHDPWMSTPMRVDFGLPHPDRRIGQSAHDFLMACSAPEVIITRSQKVDGTPTVPSRWLNRLEALADIQTDLQNPFFVYAQQLDRSGHIVPIAPPEPRPPLEARPKMLSVTRVQKLMQDPYGLYAEKILNLSPLEDLDAEPGALERGNFIHDALDRFVADTLDHWPDDALHLLLNYGREAFAPYADRPAVAGFWWPRFVQVAEWFVRHEPQRRAHYHPLATEVSALLKIPGCLTDFALYAKADRIDLHLDSGAVHIIDYKTGSLPSAKQIKAGFAPQMPLEGLLAQDGGFADIDAAQIDGLTFWRVTGGDVPVEIVPIRDHDNRIEEARKGLIRLISDFANPETPYLSQPRPAFAGYGDHDHLARVRAWRTVGLGGGNGP